ncbi:MAG: pilus assembly protein TadG-related protein [Sagittula sp.]|uniref:pilus assembly protein TadG-related protein n=1 Tax=Sagittula sp. TaxID=2038081 RepID=UPI004059FA77
MKRLTHFIADLAGDEEGTMTIFSTFMMVLILAITGASVDIMYQEATRARLQAALDRAVLAAADLDQQQDPVAVVNDYVTKAGLAEHLTDVIATPGLNDRTVAADAGLILDTYFLRMSGWQTLPVIAASTAEERIANVEISLVMDISGSMRWNNRITNARTAAKDFVSKVLTEDSAGVTTLNLIPFAGQVNPGDVMFDYFRGVRPKIQQGNNGWGNGDQDAPGGSLCTNNAENADEGAIDPSCADGTGTTATDTGGYFSPWPQPIANIVVYFDTNGDDIYDRAHKIINFPDGSTRDIDDIYQGVVAYLIDRDPLLMHPDQFLGISLKGGQEKNRYFQVKGDGNGPFSDIGPTKNNGKVPGEEIDYAVIDFAAWAASYVAPVAPVEAVNVNMPSSCVEIYDAEFANTDLPQSDNYVPHFMFWPYVREVMDWGWCPGEDTAIQYYSDDAATLSAFIDNMRMHDGTGIQYGLKYALALLDPATGSAVTELVAAGLVDSRFLGRPIAWEDEETEKFIVVMSDGAVTDQYRPLDPFAPVNGETELETQGIGTFTTVSTRGNSLDNLHTQCQLARDLGVTVFAVAFETTDADADELRLCASSESHFFHVQGTEIIDAFDTIARQINNLRLIQ